MCIYVYVYMFMYVYIHIDVYIYMCVYKHVLYKIREVETERRANQDTLCFLCRFIFQDLFFLHN